MIKHLLTIAAVSVASLTGSAQVGQADGDSIVPKGDAKYETGVFYRITSLIFKTASVGGFISGQERASINIPEQFFDSISNSYHTVTSVAPDAFSGHTELTEVTLPNSVTRIGARSFKGCSLEKAVIPGSTYHVEEEAYADNPLKEVYIYSPGVEGVAETPTHSVELQNHAFGSESGNITDVYITYPNPPIVDDASTPFPQEAARNKSATIHLPADADIEAYKTAHCWKDFFTDPVPTSINAVEGADNVASQYFTITGRAVSGKSLAPGLYIVKRGKSAAKVLVR